MPDDPHISDTLGWILYKRGVYQQATALLRESAAKRPESPEIQYHLGMASLLATPVVMVAAGLVALLLGAVVTRASGLALAVATLMLPLIATGYISSAGYLGGSVGAPLTGNLWAGSTTQSIAIGNGLITVAVLALVVLAAARILSSDIGLELYVLGVDEPTAAAMGVRTPRRRLELFVLGSVFAALGGAIYAGTQLFVPATLASPTAELALLMMLFVGGRRSVIDAVAGAVAIQYLSGERHPAIAHGRRPGLHLADGGLGRKVRWL